VKPGDVLAGRYELEELVGTGGMSSVFRARDRVLDRLVALKVLHRQYAGDGEHVERFRREAMTVAGLVHENIVTVIDRGEDDGCPFIVLELVAGESLKQLVARSGPLPVERALALGIQVARGLAYAHEHGFVHRDVKPQNVLVNGDGRAKVTDFGIARPLEIKHGVTQTGTVLGTPDYIAPEQAQGQRVGEHTDVYSLGVVLFELLTGRVPFPGETFVAVAMRHINEPAPRISSLRPDVPARLDAAVARALAKRPEERFPTMRAFGRELEACLDDLREGGAPTVVLPGAAARRPARGRGRGRRAPGAAALLGAGLALGAAALVGALLRGAGGGGPPVARGGGTAVHLRAVAAYDPPPGDGVEDDSRLRLATDGDPATAWATEHYANPHFGNLKSGVGIVLDAGGTVRLARLVVVTDTPGFTARVEAGDGPHGPFHALTRPELVGRRTTFELGGARARYFVLWITDLGPHAFDDVNEVRAST